MPGFTPTSMFPLIWAASGIDYPALVDRLLQPRPLHRPIGRPCAKSPRLATRCHIRGGSGSFDRIGEIDQCVHLGTVVLGRPPRRARSAERGEAVAASSSSRNHSTPLTSTSSAVGSYAAGLETPQRITMAGSPHAAVRSDSGDVSRRSPSWTVSGRFSASAVHAVIAVASGAGGDRRPRPSRTRSAERSTAAPVAAILRRSASSRIMSARASGDGERGGRSRERETL